MSLLLSILLCGCGAYEKTEEKAVLTVGTRAVTRDELKKDIIRAAAEMDIASEDWPRLRESLFQRRVEHYLILEYGREKGIAVSAEDLEAAVREIQGDYGKADFREVLLKRYIDFEEWKAGLKDRLLIRKIMKAVSETIPPVTSEEIKAFYEEHEGEFRHPPMVKVMQVVTRSKGEAQEILKRLAGGECMEGLARKHSISPDGKGGGDMGWIAKGDLEEKMEKVIFSLPVGQSSPVVETSYGFHIFRVISKRPEGIRRLPEVMAEIEERLFSQKEEAFYKSWLAEIRERYPVWIAPDLLEKLELG
ncbi:MAG: peptidyl-prolyl cis-trans isomerase [Deltaproteobacteria bacterium]|nr:peptidyl-prolyl cis-trans isomerase [Deltaproteobacteria bacterium]